MSVGTTNPGEAGSVGWYLGAHAPSYLGSNRVSGRAGFACLSGES
jgi:hypothetical protein